MRYFAKRGVILLLIMWAHSAPGSEMGLVQTWQPLEDVSSGQIEIVPVMAADMYAHSGLPNEIGLITASNCPPTNAPEGQLRDLNVASRSQLRLTFQVTGDTISVTLDARELRAGKENGEYAAEEIVRATLECLRRVTAAYASRVELEVQSQEKDEDWLQPLVEDFPSARSAAFGAQQFTLTPIGQVEKPGDRTFLVLKEDLAPALMGLEAGSHVWVFWWFDRNDTPEKRRILQVHPRGNPDNPLKGVFATRAPVRPNPIALTLCKIVKIEGATIEIEKIDAFAGTPILDLKPYISGYDGPAGED